MPVELNGNQIGTISLEGLSEANVRLSADVILYERQVPYL